MHAFDTADTGIIIAMVVVYIVLTSWLTLRMRSRDNGEFLYGGHALPAGVIGVLLMSEFIGAKSTIGTAEGAFSLGMAAAWAVLSAAFGFLLFGLFMAGKLYASGEFTISGAISQRYGRTTQLTVSVIMMYALLLVNVGNYLSGAAALASVLHVDLRAAAIIVAMVSTLYFTFGGLKSVAYVAVLHTGIKYLGVLIVLGIALSLTHGLTPMVQALPAFYFTWDGHVGTSTIVAYFIGNVGAIFSTQYIVQAVAATRSPAAARRSAFWAAGLCVPIALALGLIGVAAKYLYPEMDGLYALPVFMANMNVWTAGFVAISLVASIFVAVSTVALAISSLVVRDFYTPYARPTPEQAFRATRRISFVVGLLPLALIVLAPQLLQLSFFTRALRLSISIVALIGFYLPMLGGNRGATLGLIFATVTTTLWYLAGNPWGIDNMYVALVTPALVMVLERVLRRRPLPARDAR